MDFSFEQALVEVWRQTLVEDAKVVELGKERYTVRHTPNTMHLARSLQPDI
jgi:hypothetical protein